MKSVIIVLFVTICLANAKQHIPKYIKTCSQNDPKLSECFARNANLALKFIAKGDPAYKIKTLQPLVWLPLFEVNTPPFKIDLIDALVYGLENFTVIDPKIDLRKNSLQFTFRNPLIIWKLQYKAQLNVNGTQHEVQGDGAIYFHNGHYAWNFDYELQDIDGEKFANITKVSAKFTNVKLDFHLPELDTSEVFKENWDELKKNFINNELEKACAWTVAEFINKIFNVVPFNEVFTP